MISATTLELARRVAVRLGEIDGVVAVVLGGSQGRGEPRDDSDIDLGLYYHISRPPSIEALRALARELDNRHPETAVTDFGEWGPWVNGGAWLLIEGQHVDWLFREIGRVAEVIDECRAGRVTCDYYLGHPHGFHNHIYVGEVHYCRPLVDPTNVISALKALTAVYPATMRRAIVDRYLYDARFMLELARKPAHRGDTFHVAGCFFRVAAALVQVLFALNERYFTNEKGSVDAIRAFPLKPSRFGARVTSVLGRPGTTPARLTAAADQFDRLVGEVAALCGRSGLA